MNYELSVLTVAKNSDADVGDAVIGHHGFVLVDSYILEATNERLVYVLPDIMAYDQDAVLLISIDLNKDEPHEEISLNKNLLDAFNSYINS